jgi:hypothetical protein
MGKFVPRLIHCKKIEVYLVVDRDELDRVMATCYTFQEAKDWIEKIRHLQDEKVKYYRYDIEFPDHIDSPEVCAEMNKYLETRRKFIASVMYNNDMME